MHNIITIKELVQHILSFVPRKIIIPCALTCKNFHNAITIDYNQETVAKNSDMFSLLKIPYSFIVVSNISVRNNNVAMFEYLLQKHNFNVGNIDGLYRSIGYSGNEILLDKYLEDTRLNILLQSTIKIGICEGLHIDLINKYNLHDGYDCVLALYKTNIDKTNLERTITKFPGHKTIIIEGYCARETACNVKLYIQKLIDNDTIHEYIKNIYIGLFFGEKYDLIVWLSETYEFIHTGNELMNKIIINNNFQLFKLGLSLNKTNNRKRVNLRQWIFINEFNYVRLALNCIEYRRLDMLEFLINHVLFNTARYKMFLAKAESLSFHDVKNLLITNSSLFEPYDEKNKNDKNF